ncbi:MAG TPA: enoyl-CoA hydratase-related protein [Thermomonospora sp.]|nr:enoyl-CoA hydratase-related protein [Thermomonospora sp.]
MIAMSYAEVMERAREETRTLVTVEREGARAVVRLDDPGKLNTLSAAMMLQLREGLAGVLADPEVRAVVLTGTDPGFCTGGDLRMMREAVQRLADPADEAGATLPWRFIREQFGGVVRLITGAPAPVVAAVNGAAAGVGLAMALACDLIVASDRAVLVPAFGRLGLLPEVGTSWFVTRRLGYQRAFEYYVSGDHLPAARALELGLVNEVVPHDDLMARAGEWCERMIALPEHALAMVKPLLRQSMDMTWEQSLVMEEFAEPGCFTTKPFARAVEGMLGR